MGGAAGGWKWESAYETGSEKLEGNKETDSGDD